MTVGTPLLNKPSPYNKAQSGVDIYFSGAGTTVKNKNYTIYKTELPLNATSVTNATDSQVTDANFDLYRDNVEKGTLSNDTVEYISSNYTVGTYYFNSTFKGNENYTSFTRDPTVTVKSGAGLLIRWQVPNRGEEIYKAKKKIHNMVLKKLEHFPLDG